MMSRSRLCQRRGWCRIHDAGAGVLLTAALVMIAGRTAWADPPAAKPPQPVAAAAAVEEYWDLYFMQGNRVGYVHSEKRRRRDKDGERIEFMSQTKFGVARAGEAHEQTMTMRSLETPDGAVIRCGCEANLGPTPTLTFCTVDGAKLLIEQQQGGKTSKSSLAWPAGTLGYFGTEESLVRKPMQPGESRKIKLLLPIFNQLADDSLTAVDYEDAKLLHGTQRLLRIDSVQRLADGAEVKSIFWSDRHGNVLKMHTELGQQDVYRCTKQEALAPAGAAKFDMIQDTLVRTKKPLAAATIAKAPQIRYAVRLKDGDPAKTFATGATQQFIPGGERAGELIVWAAGPGKLPDRKDMPNEPEPGKEFLASSGLLQTDDPAVQKLAASLPAENKKGPPDQRAIELEKLVYRTIINKNFSQALASAAEVAKSKEGDCTEHAVLLAALARVNGIPSRVAMGLVYVPQLGGFAFHMWTEVYVERHWLPLDATLGLGYADATHLKLTTSSLADGDTYGALLRHDAGRGPARNRAAVTT